MKLSNEQLKRLIEQVVQEKSHLPVGSAAVGAGDVADKITKQIIDHLDVELLDKGEAEMVKRQVQDRVYDRVVDMMLSLEEELEAQGVRINWHKR